MDNILKNNQLNQKKMAVVSEQGLGENILFSSIYNDLIKINPSTIFIALSVFSIFVSIFVYKNGLPKHLDFKGDGEKLKLPEPDKLPRER